jgi:3-oxoacyl-[acyl-carrier-protein] synthase-3
MRVGMMAKISRIEYYLPEIVSTNEDLAGENPGWDFGLIEPKTGIKARHIAASNERASDLAVKAAEILFDKGRVDRKTIDTLIYCTQSPDYPLPSTSCIIQDRLGLSTKVAAFDFNLGCSGYIYGLALCHSMIHSGISKRIVFLCAETYSKYISPTDRSARVLFGDAGTATLVEPSNGPQSVGPFVLGTDGSGMDKIIVQSTKGNSEDISCRADEPRSILSLDGPGVFMFTMKRAPECTRDLLAKANKTLDEIDLFVFHQASKIVIDNIARILSLDEKKVFRGYEEIGNTVSASIPIAIKQAEEQNRIKKGDLVMLVGFGVGLSWGGCLMQR